MKFCYSRRMKNAVLRSALLYALAAIQFAPLLLTPLMAKECSESTYCRMLAQFAIALISHLATFKIVHIFTEKTLNV
jgi:hypothetical protein